MSEEQRPIRVAAIGDIHVREDQVTEIREFLQAIARQADIMVLCGDLTNRGLLSEAESLAEILIGCRVPVLAVLGNHDYENDRQDEIRDILHHGGVHMLDREPRELLGVGFAGVKGFYGGFDSATLAPFGERLVKEFVQETVNDALHLESGLAHLRTPYKIAVLHYSPVRDTVIGEPPEIYPFMGSSRLAEPIDRYRATAVVHGHAHGGSLEGRTLSGIPVYNVAMPLLRRVSPERPFRLLELPPR